MCGAAYVALCRLVLCCVARPCPAPRCGALRCTALQAVVVGRVTPCCSVPRWAALRCGLRRHAGAPGPVETGRAEFAASQHAPACPAAPRPRGLVRPSGTCQFADARPKVAACSCAGTSTQSPRAEGTATCRNWTFAPRSIRLRIRPVALTRRSISRIARPKGGAATVCRQVVPCGGLPALAISAGQSCDPVLVEAVDWGHLCRSGLAPMLKEMCKAASFTSGPSSISLSRGRR